MSAFAVFCLLTAALFSLYAFAFAYTVEDQFFATMLEEQAQRQQHYFAQHGQWPPTENPNVKMYFRAADLPEEVRKVLSVEPRRNELAGAQGRHYHLRRMALADGAEAWLVAEVSQKLVFRRMRGTVLEILLYSTLGVLVSALVLAWYLARNTALPISRLSAMLAGLQPAQLPMQLPHNHSLSEVGVLTRGVNGLIQRVREFVEREQSFTRDVSHELRTPLTVVRCAAEQLVAAPNLAPDALATLQLILRSTAQLQHTIETLLTIAREEHHALANPSPSRLLPVLERVVVEQSPLLAEKDVLLHIQIDHAQQAQLPEPLLHIVLSNLLGNAFAHCDSQSEITLFIQHQRLCIRNQSAVALAPDAFNAFSKHAGSSGFGLGLAIVQRLSDRFELDLRLTHSDRCIEASFALHGAG